MHKHIENTLDNNQYTWLVTGAAGFIGLNIVEQLLLFNQKVVGIDSFFSSSEARLDHAINKLALDNPQKNIKQNFKFYHTDITDYDSCLNIYKDNKIDFVMHHAAVASVALSIEQPRIISKVNIDGFVNILDLSKDFNIKALIYASSSAVYGDNNDSFKKENNIGNQLSPYAISKYTNELFANQYSKYYNLNTIGLRYFNIYGKYQDQNGAYAAVIPKWINSIINNGTISINGDGSTTRDFCPINQVVNANILSCLNFLDNKGIASIYNIGTGHSISLNLLLDYLLGIAKRLGLTYSKGCKYSNFLEGDIRHSCADITLAASELNFIYNLDFEHSLTETFKWFTENDEK